MPRTRPRPAPSRHSPVFEPLESRILLSGMTAATIRHAYGFDRLGLTGSGQTIAIVGAYDAPTIAQDLDVFSARMGIPGGPASSFLYKHKMTPNLKADVGWAQELSMDVQWAHAIAPGAKILLVEAASAYMSDMLAAVNWARRQPGVSVVSMSWGGTEFLSQSVLDSSFATPAGHAGVTFVAASGDDGGVASYPAMSTSVLSVGGTRLVVDANGGYLGEGAWSGSGGGISEASGAPAWQSFTGLPARLGPDVAYVADPATGVLVYGPTGNGGSGWMTFGGTSAGAPQWAGLLALANEGRAIAGLPPLEGATQTLPAIYAAPPAVFRDIVHGSTNEWIRANPGYDLATGRGSPEAVGMVQYLIGYNKQTPAIVRGAGMAFARTSAQVRPAAIPLETITREPVLARAVEWFTDSALHRKANLRPPHTPLTISGNFPTLPTPASPAPAQPQTVLWTAAASPAGAHPLMVTSPVTEFTVTASDWVL